MIAQIVTLLSFEMVVRHVCAFETRVTHIVCFALGETMADKDSSTRESRFYANHPIIFGILFAIIPCLLSAYLGDLHGQSAMVGELSKRFDSVEESMSLNEALESAYRDYANAEAELNALKDEEAGKQVLADATAAWDSGKHEEALTSLSKASKKSGDCAEPSGQGACVHDGHPLHRSDHGRRHRPRVWAHQVHRQVQDHAWRQGRDDRRGVL